MGYQRRVHGRTIRNSSIMKTAALAPFLLMFVLSVLHQETAAVCSGCGCNIFCCNCDSACGQDSCGPPGCCVDGMSPEESVDNCCSEKIVGNITYTLLPGLPDIETHPKTAKNGCIYTVKGILQVTDMLLSLDTSQLNARMRSKMELQQKLLTKPQQLNHL